MTVELNREALIRELDASGLSTYEMETLTGLARSTLRRWRSGTIRRVRVSSLELVASALGVLAAELVL